MRTARSPAGIHKSHHLGVPARPSMFPGRLGNSSPHGMLSFSARVDRDSAHPQRHLKVRLVDTVRKPVGDDDRFVTCAGWWCAAR